MGKGLVEWWNLELKDQTPAWAAKITTLRERDILATAREFGGTRPAMAIMERGARARSNGVYSAMAIHTLNALVGSRFAKGGLMYQMAPPYGDLPANADDFMDEYATRGPWKQYPRIDLKGHPDGYLLANSMMQEVGPNHLAGKPYKLDTVMFYCTKPISTAPNGQVWERALQDLFVIDTSPFPSETGHFADLILPDHTYLERMQDAPPYPFEGYPLTQLRVPAVEPLYDTKYFGDTIIEIGKRIKGPMGEYYKKPESAENVIGHLAKGFKRIRATTESTVRDVGREGGLVQEALSLASDACRILRVGRQGLGETDFARGGRGQALEDPIGQVRDPFGLARSLCGVDRCRDGPRQDQADVPDLGGAEAPGRPGPLSRHAEAALHAEGRGHDIPMVVAHLQPVVGGRGEAFAEINPETARQRGIKDRDWIKIRSSVGEIRVRCRSYEGVRPDTIVLPMEWGHWRAGHWSMAVPGGHSGECTVNQSDRIPGQCNYYTTKVTVERA